MNLNNLIAFIKVIQTKSFNAAAKQLGISQPAVSMRVQALEDYFGKKLIIRLSDGVQLTKAGEIAYDQIQVILYEWERLEQQLKGNKMTGIVKLGASTIPSEYLLPKILGNFKHEYPIIQVNTSVAGSREVVKWLIDGTVDIIITGKQKNTSDFFIKKIYEDELVLIAPTTLKGNKLPNTVEDLANLEWILREPGSDTRKVWENFLTENDLLNKIEVVGQMGSNEAVIGAVEAGLGVSVVSSLAAKRAEMHGRVQIIANNLFTIKRPFYLVTLKENMKHPIVEMFVGFVDGDLEG